MVDSSGLENRQAGNGLEGSNPSLSASDILNLPLVRGGVPKWLKGTVC